jgi:uncharacterized protein YndB with AHSA1/START domain
MELQLDIDVQAPPAVVFDLIADLRGYDRWLTTSKSFPGTTEVSTDPVAVGTTYVESGPDGMRRGTVTELERPERVAFHQPMSLKPGLLGAIDILVRYTLTPTEGGTHVHRTVTLALPWQLKPAQPLVMRRFRGESERTMAALKTRAEG